LGAIFLEIIGTEKPGRSHPLTPSEVLISLGGQSAPVNHPTPFLKTNLYGKQPYNDANSHKQSPTALADRDTARR
jgi:hypothetical protein